VEPERPLHDPLALFDGARVCHPSLRWRLYRDFCRSLALGGATDSGRSFPLASPVNTSVALLSSTST
jgi:hypothetical protein